MGKTVYIYGEAEKYPNYKLAVESAGGGVIFGGADASGTAYDALLLPGGGDMEAWRYGQEDQHCRDVEPERDAAELALLEACAAAGTPVLGICRGLQVINVFFGGTLRQDIPMHSAVEGVDRQHGVETLPSPLYGLYGAHMTVNSSHHQAADRLGEGLQAAQWSEDGIVEAVIHETLPIWAVQWHPERYGPKGLRLIDDFLKKVDAGFFAKLNGGY